MQFKWYEKNILKALFKTKVQQRVTIALIIITIDFILEYTTS